MSLLVSMVIAAPRLLWGVLQEEKDWMGRIQEHQRWATAGNEQQWPEHNHTGWPLWWRLIKETPQRLKRLIQKKLAEEREAILFKEATQTGPCQGMVVSWLLQKGFDSKAKLSLSLRYFKKHNRMATYRFFRKGKPCEACSTQCWTEGRLAVHLRAFDNCVRALQEAGRGVEQVAPGETTSGSGAVHSGWPRKGWPVSSANGSHALESLVYSRRTMLHAACDALHDSSEDALEQQIVTDLQKIFVQHPLYQQEEDDVLTKLEDDLKEIQADPEANSGGHKGCDPQGVPGGNLHDQLEAPHGIQA